MSAQSPDQQNNGTLPALDKYADDYDRAISEQPEPVDTTSDRRMWIGLLAVTIIFLSIYSPLTPIHSWIASWLSIRTFYEEIVFDILYQWLGAACVLLIIWWDGAPLGVFGLKKPAWSVDTIIACITFAVRWKLGFIAVDLFIGFLHTLNYKVPTSLPIFRFSEVQHGWTGLFLLFILSMSIGFTEELVMRGYLISRLERVVKSKPSAILISAAFFSCCHLRRGIVAVWGAFWGGIIYGIVFVLTRRLWPTVFTHAAYDFLVFLSRA